MALVLGYCVYFWGHCCTDWFDLQYIRVSHPVCRRTDTCCNICQKSTECCWFASKCLKYNLLFVCFLTFPLLQTGLEISCWAPRVQTPNILPSQWCKTEKTYLLANSFLTDFLQRHKYKQLYLMRTNCWNTAFEQFPLYALNVQFLSWRKLMRWLFENVIAPISSVTHYLNSKTKTIN